MILVLLIHLLLAPFTDAWRDVGNYQSEPTQYCNALYAQQQTNPYAVNQQQNQYYTDHQYQQQQQPQQYQYAPYDQQNLSFTSVRNDRYQ